VRLPRRTVVSLQYRLQKGLPDTACLHATMSDYDGVVLAIVLLLKGLGSQSAVPVLLGCSTGEQRTHKRVGTLFQRIRTSNWMLTLYGRILFAVGVAFGPHAVLIMTDGPDGLRLPDLVGGNPAPPSSLGSSSRC
jgi:hypothetical protein